MLNFLHITCLLDIIFLSTINIIYLFIIIII